jgi:protein O-mannosyl-transferase
MPMKSLPQVSPSRTATNSLRAGPRLVNKPSGGAIANARRAQAEEIRPKPRWSFWASAGLAALTGVVYSRTAWYPFVNFDDGEYVFENAHVRAGLTWNTVKWAFMSMTAGNWHPLTWLSHSFDAQLFGLNAGAHHVTSLLLHTLNTILLFLVLTDIGGSRWRSLTVAALFAVHPLNVESVAWIAERKNLLCTFFFLLAVAAYAWYARRPTFARYGCVAALFALGLAAKPMIITLPLVLLLLDWWPLNRVLQWSPPSSFEAPKFSPLRLLLEKLPLLLLALASGVITVIAQHNAGAIAHVAGWSLAWRIQNALHSYAMYLITSLLPINLAPFYPGADLHRWQVVWAALLISGMTWLVWKYRVTRPYLVFGWLWFLGTLVPVIGMVQVGAQARADRYTYIPLIGLLIAAVWGLSEAVQGIRWDAPRRYVAIGAVTVLLVLSWQQLSYWRSSYELWSHTLEVTNNNFVAEANLAVSMVDLDREEDAFPHFERTLFLQPDNVVALLNTGNYLEKQGKHRESIERFERVLDLTHDPDKLTGAYRGLGVAYAQLGDRAKARSNFLQALRLNPSGQSEMYNLSLLEVRDGIDRLTKYLAATPSAQGYLQLGQLLQEDARIDDAVVAYEHALKLNPKFTEAKIALTKLQQPTNGQ